MTEPKSALDIYLAWFEERSPEIQRELTRALMQWFPGSLLEPAVITPDPTDGFVPRVRRLARTPVAEAGVALCLAQLTDVAFVERAETEGVNRTDAMLAALNEASEALSGAVGDWVEEQRLRQPLRARQWAKEHPVWSALRQDALSTENVLRDLRKRQLAGLDSSN